MQSKIERKHNKYLLEFSYKKINTFYNSKVKYHRPLFTSIVVGYPNRDDSPSIVVVHMDSYHSRNTTHVTFIEVIINMKIGVFIGCGYGSFYLSNLLISKCLQALFETLAMLVSSL